MDTFHAALNMRGLWETSPKSNRNKIRMHMEQVYKQKNPMKITISSAKCKTIYHNGSYLLLFRKKQ